MHLCFFDHKGTVHYESIAQEQRVKEQCYFEVPTRLQESLRRERPKLWPDKWILHYDKAPVHDALIFCKFLAKKSNANIDHPSYSPDLVPCDFWLFPKLKRALTGQRFADIPDIQHNMTLL
jgi:histone-lysine N-methyltransferase SETMAR